MAELKNLLVNGVERINGDLYVSGNIHGTASNAVSASYATNATSATTASYNADGAAAKSWITDNSGNLNTVWDDLHGSEHGNILTPVYVNQGVQECASTLIETVTDTRTAAGAAYKGNTVDITLTHGRIVAFVTRYAGASNATLELVSGSSTTGAKPIFFSGTTRLSTQYPANSLIFLVYDTASNSGAGGWRVHADYNTNTT